MRDIGLAICVALALAVLSAETARSQSSIACGGFYEVAPGDTLREIAVNAYGVGNYQLIFNANREILESPALLLVGQRLFIPCLDGSGPRTRQEAEAAASVAPGDESPIAPDPRPEPAALTDDPAPEEDEVAGTDTAQPARSDGQPAPVPPTGTSDGTSERAESRSGDDGTRGPAFQPMATGPRATRTSEIIPRPPRTGTGDRAERASARADGSAGSAGDAPAPDVPVQPAPEDEAGERGAMAGIQPAAGERAPGDESAANSGAIPGLQPAPGAGGGNRAAAGRDTATTGGVDAEADAELAQARESSQPAPATGGIQPAPSTGGSGAGGNPQAAGAGNSMPVRDSTGERAALDTGAAAPSPNPGMSGTTDPTGQDASDPATPRRSDLNGAPGSPPPDDAPSGRSSAGADAAADETSGSRTRSNEGASARLARRRPPPTAGTGDGAPALPRSSPEDTARTRLGPAGATPENARRAREPDAPDSADPDGDDSDASSEGRTEARSAEPRAGPDTNRTAAAGDAEAGGEETSAPDPRGDRAAAPAPEAGRRVFGLPADAGPVTSRAPSAPEMSPGGVQPLPNVLPMADAGEENEDPAELARAAPADSAPEKSAQTPAGPIRVLGAPMPPYAGETLPARGMIADLMGRALGHARPGVELRISFVGDRALHLGVLLPDGAYDVGMPWLKPDCDARATLEDALRRRCEDFLWSAPLQEVVVGYFVRSGSALTGSTDFADLRGQRVCRPAGFARVDLAANGLGTGAAPAVTGRDARDCFARLIAGEADVVSLPVGVAEPVLARPSFEGRVAEVSGLADILTLHAITARGNARGRRILSELNQGLEVMRENGEWFRVIRRHLAKPAASDG